MTTLEYLADTDKSIMSVRLWLYVLVATLFGFGWGYMVTRSTNHQEPTRQAVVTEEKEPTYGNSESQDITPCKTPTPKPKASKKLI